MKEPVIDLNKTAKLSNPKEKLNRLKQSIIYQVSSTLCNEHQIFHFGWVCSLRSPITWNYHKCGQRKKGGRKD